MYRDQKIQNSFLKQNFKIRAHMWTICNHSNLGKLTFGHSQIYPDFIKKVSKITLFRIEFILVILIIIFVFLWPVIQSTKNNIASSILIPTKFHASTKVCPLSICVISRLKKYGHHVDHTNFFFVIALLAVEINKFPMIIHDLVWRWQIMVTQQIFKTIILMLHCLHEVV